MTDMAPAILAPRPPMDEAELHPVLRRFVQGQIRHGADSEDIVQEIYVRLYDYRSRRSVADVGAFCFAVARNLIRDHLRRRYAAPQTTELAPDIACPAPRADEILAYRERVEILIRALKAMPPLRREVFTRHRLEGHSTATIAGELGLSAAAVEKHCTRAVADLRLALERRGLTPGDRA